jgi:hypothetical protein
MSQSKRVAGINLTLLERDVLGGIYASNYTDGGPRPMIWSWSMEPKVATQAQRPGVVASLVKKGVVTCGGTGTKDDDKTIDVTDIGVECATALGIWSKEDGYSEAGHLAAVATPAQMVKVVNKVLGAKGGPVILSAAEAKQLRELLETASSINRDYLKKLDKKRQNDGCENYIERFQAGVAVLVRKGAK